MNFQIPPVRRFSVPQGWLRYFQLHIKKMDYAFLLSFSTFAMIISYQGADIRQIFTDHSINHAPLLATTAPHISHRRDPKLLGSLANLLFFPLQPVPDAIAYEIRVEAALQQRPAALELYCTLVYDAEMERCVRFFFPAHPPATPFT